MSYSLHLTLALLSRSVSVFFLVIPYTCMHTYVHVHNIHVFLAVEADVHGACPGLVIFNNLCCS